MRKILLDTHAVIWWLDGDPQLGELASKCISDSRNEVFVSAATNWEISIKKAIGKLDAADDLDSIIDDEGFTKLAISNFHGDQAGKLPLHHRDPFDRMLIAQAQSEGLELLTKDEVFPLYSVRTINAFQ